MINKTLSQQIYRELINGKVINQYCYDNGEMYANPYYQELFNLFDSHYQTQYENLGFELVLREGFVFIRSLEQDESSNDVAMKIQALLVVIARGIMELGYEFDLFSSLDAGINDTLLEKIDVGERRDILDACELKKSLVIEVKNVLTARNITYRNGKNNLVLSDAGRWFFDEVFTPAH